MRFPKYSLTLAAGAMLMYLLDPANGRARRARLSDQFAAEARETVDRAERQIRYQAGRLKGAIHETLTGDRDFPVDDAELLQKVRSEAVGPSGIATDDIEIHVESGEVVIRGSGVDDPAILDLMERIRSVTGVKAVRTEPAAA